MKNLIVGALVASMLASTAFAGGPVVIVEEGEPIVIAEKPASSIGILPLLLIPVILCVVLCDRDDDPQPPPPPPEPPCTDCNL